MKKTYEAIVKLLVPLKEEAVYKVIVHEASRLIKADQGSIFILKKGSLVRVYSTVSENKQLEPRNNGNVEAVLKSGKPKYLTSRQLKSAHPEIASQIKSIAIIPLSFQDERLGVLTMQSKKALRISEKTKDSLLLFGAVCSLAIRNAQLYTQKEKALETRDLFMSVASHELKTPLTSIKGYAQLIQKSEVPKPSWSEAIVRNADRLNEMIQYLFALSQITAGSFTITKKKFDLAELVINCVKDFQVASKRQVNFHSDTQTVNIRGDQIKLYSVITNLLRNAAKYSESDSLISVRLSCTSEAVITVADQGHGISPENLKKIFKKYFRGQNKKGGLGLGLYIGKRIINGHDGEIQIKSAINQGTEVTVTLPLA